MRVLVTYTQVNTSVTPPMIRVCHAESSGFFGTTWKEHLREAMQGHLLPETNNLGIEFGWDIDTFIDGLPFLTSEASRILAEKGVKVTLYDIESGRGVAL